MAAFIPFDETLNPPDFGTGGGIGSGGAEVPPILIQPPPPPTSVEVLAPIPFNPPSLPEPLPPPTVETPPPPETPPPTVTQPQPPLQPFPPVQGQPPQSPIPPETPQPQPTPPEQTPAPIALPPPIKIPRIPFPIVLPPRLPTPTVPPGFTQAPPPSGPTLGGNFPGTTTPPIIVNVPSTTVTESISLSPTPVTVVVNNLETIGADVVSALSAGVNYGLQSLEDYNAQLFQSAISGIGGYLTNLTEGLGGLIANAISAIASKIGSILSGIASGIADIAKAVGEAIGKSIASVAAQIANLFKDIPALLAKVLQTVGTVLTKIVIPILRRFSQIYPQIALLLKQLHIDIGNSIAAQIAGLAGITGAIGSLNTTLYNTWTEIRPDLQADAESNIRYGEEVTWQGLQANLYGLLNKNFSATQSGIDYAPGNHLDTLNVEQVTDNTISCVKDILAKLYNDLNASWTDRLNHQMNFWQIEQNLYAGLVSTVIAAGLNVITLLATASPLLDYARQSAYQCLPVTPIEAGDMVDALRRGFTDQLTFNTELRRRGIDATRAQLLFDLSRHLESTGDLTEYFHRGLIDEGTYFTGLAHLGFDTAQARIYEQSTYHLPSVEEALTWYQRGKITLDQVIALMKQNRYTQPMIENVLASYTALQSTRDYISLQGLFQAQNTGFLSSTLGLPTPSDVFDVGMQNATDPLNTRLQWQQHWSIPVWQEFLNFAWRNKLDFSQVKAAMTAQNIPAEVQDMLINISQPLIPYRSIPQMVKLGAMSLQDAESELIAHGFTRQRIDWIFGLIAASKNAGNANKAKAQYEASVGAAKQLFDAHAITKDEYIHILVEHGENPDIATVQADVEEVHEALRERKQLLTDLEAEVIAGLLPADVAIAQLVLNGATPAEIARFDNRVARALRGNTKNPSIAELDKFAKARLIDQDHYKQSVQKLGYGEPWIDNFAALIYTTPQQKYVGDAT